MLARGPQDESDLFSKSIIIGPDGHQHRLPFTAWKQRKEGADIMNVSGSSYVPERKRNIILSTQTEVSLQPEHPI